jgi:hypothetical protein
MPVFIAAIASIFWGFAQNIQTGNGVAAQPIEDLQVTSGRLRRIAEDITEYRYWILNYSQGAVLLSFDGESWLLDEYPLGEVRDMTGPDSQGYLYFTVAGYNPGILAFNTASATVVDTIPLNHYPAGLTLSPDESMLYVCAFEWPPIEEPEYGSGEGNLYQITNAHPDKGLILEVDISTHAVERSVNVGTYPNTIYYASLPGGDKLVVSTYQTVAHLLPLGEDPEPDELIGQYMTLDFVDLDSFTRMEPRLETPDVGEFKTWLPDNSLVAFCIRNIMAVSHDPSYYDDSIWLIDPATGTIADTITVYDTDGEKSATSCIEFSSINPDEMYVAIGMPTHYIGPGYDRIMVLDTTSYQRVRTIGLGEDDLLPHFVKEGPCGELIVTAGGRPEGSILIITSESIELLIQ